MGIGIIDIVLLSVQQWTPESIIVVANGMYGTIALRRDDASIEDKKDFFECGQAQMSRGGG